MGFQLVIAEGKDAGKEFFFDQGSVVIGRTTECDVILYDPGVSRKHARIFSEGTDYFVEDMGSSNGTKVNGSIVSRRQLKNGDALALGPVVFNFSAAATEEASQDSQERGPGETSDDEGARDSSTRIVKQELVRRDRRRQVAMAPDGADEEALSQIERSSTRAMDKGALRRAMGSGDELEAVDEARPSRRRSREGSGEREESRPLSFARTPISASERARIRRESSPFGATLRIFWREAGLLTRYSLQGVAGLVLLSILGVGFYLAVLPPDSANKLPPEPGTLTRKPLEYSFGYGEGVQYERKDQKIFAFDYSAPVKAVVIVHFQSKDISQGEVIVSVNGADVGTVPADTLGADEISHEIIVPPVHLKKGQKNQVTFDNTKNPPKDETWRIWNAWVEINLLPDLPPDQLLRDATTTFERAQVTFERRDVGAQNRYEAWKDYRLAWLMLEAHPEPKPELYQLAREKVRQAQQELDKMCSKLLLEAAGAYNQKQFDQSRATLDHVRKYFPANDQPCPFRADQKRAEYGL